MGSKHADVEFRRILVPVEFSELSEAAEATALAMAQKLGASVHALHVIEPLDVLQGDPEVDRFYEKLEKQAAEALSALAGRFEARGIPFTFDVIIGHRWSVIVGQAEERNSDLIIIGSRGLEEGDPLVGLGSTSHRVAFQAPCPVMMVAPHSLERRRQPRSAPNVNEDSRQAVPAARGRSGSPRRAR